MVRVFDAVFLLISSPFVVFPIIVTFVLKLGTQRPPVQKNAMRQARKDRVPPAVAQERAGAWWTGAPGSIAGAYQQSVFALSIHSSKPAENH